MNASKSFVANEKAVGPTPWLKLVYSREAPVFFTRLVVADEVDAVAVRIHAAFLKEVIEDVVDVAHVGTDLQQVRARRQRERLTEVGPPLVRVRTALQEVRLAKADAPAPEMSTAGVRPLAEHRLAG